LKHRGHFEFCEEDKVQNHFKKLNNNMTKYNLLLLCLITIFSCQSNKNLCKLKWNTKFVGGKIDANTVKKEIPLGSDVKVLINYIQENKIPKQSINSQIDGTENCSDNIYYTNKLRNEDVFIPSMDEEKIATETAYSIELHGHELDSEIPSHYYHPILYFYFNQEDKLIEVLQFGYP